MKNLVIDKEVLLPLLSDKEKIDFMVNEKKGFSINQIIFYNYLIEVRSSDEFIKIKKEEESLGRKYYDFMKSMFEKYGVNSTN